MRLAARRVSLRPILSERERPQALHLCGLQAAVGARREGAEPVRFDARVRIDTPREAEYFRHGGILQYVLRGLLST